MPKLALIDPAAPEPRRVLGWLDTDALHYPDMPDAEQLVEVAAEDWERRMELPFMANGRLVAVPVAPALDPNDRTFEGGAWQF